MKINRIFRFFLIFLQFFLLLFYLYWIWKETSFENLIPLIDKFLPNFIVNLFSLLLAIYLYRHYRSKEGVEAQLFSVLLFIISFKTLLENYALLRIQTSLFISLFALSSLFGILLYIGIGLYQNGTSYITSDYYLYASFIGSVILIKSIPIPSQFDFLFYISNSSNLTVFSILLIALSIIAVIVLLNSVIQESSSANVFRQLALFFLLIGDITVFYLSLSTLKLVGACIFALGVIIAIIHIRKSTIWT